MGKRQRKLPSIDLWWAEWLRPLHLSEWWWLRQIVAKRLHTSQNCRKKDVKRDAQEQAPTVLNTHTPELTMDKQKLLHTHTHVWEHHTAQPKNQMPTWETRDSGFSGKKKYIFYYRDQFLEMYMLKWTMSNQFRILIPPTIFCRSHHHWRW